MHSRSWSRSAAVAGFALAGIVAAACTSDGESSPTSSEPASVLSMLRYLPDVPGVRDNAIIYGSLDRFRDGEPKATLREEVSALNEASQLSQIVADPLMRGGARDDFRDETGFDLRNVDASISAGLAPDAFSVFVGDLDPDEIADVMAAGPIGAGLERTDDGDWTLVAVGEEGTISMDDVSLARPIGESLRLGLEDGVVVWSKTVATRDAARSAVDDGGSIAQDDGYSAIAGVLDDASAATAVLMDQAAIDDGNDTRRPATTGPAGTTDASGTTGARWTVGGLGDTFVAGSDRTGLVIAFWYENEADATAAADTLRATVESGTSLVTRSPWSELLTTNSIEADGHLLVGSFATKHPGLATKLVFTRDNLFVGL